MSNQNARRRVHARQRRIARIFLKAATFEMTTQKQILISRCRILALLATTLEDVQTSEATAKGLRVIAEELDEMAVDISSLQPDDEIPLREALASFRRRTAHPLSRS